MVYKLAEKKLQVRYKSALRVNCPSINFSNFPS